MHSSAANSSLAGLGLSFDSIPAESTFSSGEESINSLFYNVDLSPPPFHSELGSCKNDNSSDGDSFLNMSEDEPEMIYYRLSSFDEEVDIADLSRQSCSLNTSDEHMHQPLSEGDGYDSDVESLLDDQDDICQYTPTQCVKTGASYPIVPHQNDEASQCASLEAPHRETSSPPLSPELASWLDNLHRAESLDVTVQVLHDSDDSSSECARPMIPNTLDPSPPADSDTDGELSEDDYLVPWPSLEPEPPVEETEQERLLATFERSSLCILRAITEEERAALAADPNPDISKFLIPAMLDASGAVVPIPNHEPAPAPTPAPPTYSRTDSFVTVDLSDETAAAC